MPVYTIHGIHGKSGYNVTLATCNARRKVGEYILDNVNPRLFPVVLVVKRLTTCGLRLEYEVWEYRDGKYVPVVWTDAITLAFKLGINPHDFKPDSRESDGLKFWTRDCYVGIVRRHFGGTS